MFKLGVISLFLCFHQPSDFAAKKKKNKEIKYSVADPTRNNFIPILCFILIQGTLPQIASSPICINAPNTKASIYFSKPFALS